MAYLPCRILLGDLTSPTAISVVSFYGISKKGGRGRWENGKRRFDGGWPYLGETRCDEENLLGTGCLLGKTQREEKHMMWRAFGLDLSRTWCASLYI